MGPAAADILGRAVFKHAIPELLAEEDPKEHGPGLLRHDGLAFRWLESSAILGKPDHEGP